MIRQLRRKFVLINMALVTALMVVICLMLVISTRDSLRADSQAVLERVISETEPSIWPFAGGGRRQEVALPYFTVVINPLGEVVVTSGQFYALEDEQVLTDIVAASFASPQQTGTLAEYGLAYLREESGFGWRVAFVDTTYADSTLRRTIWNTVTVGLGALVAFFAVSVLLARWAVRPVEQSWRQQRQFVADASHELKTPLTVILSSADLLRGWDGEDRGELARWTENICAAGGQMRELVEQLLLLARSDSDGASRQSFSAVDLSDLTQTALLMFEPVAFEAGKVLEDGAVEREITVSGDASRLKRLLDILLDNAVKYAAPGGHIRVTLRREGRRAILCVADEGEPIPKEELEAIFRRFYRGDRSRSSPGFGLGLAIARTIAAEHGGRLWAASEEGWNRFFCALPLPHGTERRVKIASGGKT